MARSCHDVSFPFQTPAEVKPSAPLSVYTGASGLERPASGVAGGGWGELAEQGLLVKACTSSAGKIPKGCATSAPTG